MEPGEKKNEQNVDDTDVRLEQAGEDVQLKGGESVVLRGLLSISVFL